MVLMGYASPAAYEMNEEDALDQIAAANGFDRHDEKSFDTDEFPKVVFASQIDSFTDDGYEVCDDERCYCCGEELL